MDIRTQEFSLCFELKIPDVYCPLSVTIRQAWGGGGLLFRTHLPQTLNISVSTVVQLFKCAKPEFLNRRSAARYGALASIIPGRERFSWNLSF